MNYYLIRNNRRICRILLVMLLCCFPLCSCGSQSNTIPPLYKVTDSGRDYTLDTEKKELYYLEVAYPYQVTKGNTPGTGTISISINHIRFSNTYSKMSMGITSGLSSVSNDATIDEQMFAMDLIDVIYEAYLSEDGFYYADYKAPGTSLAGWLLLGLGLFNLLAPRAVWFTSYGWRFKNAEPSDASLTFGRVSGAILGIIGIGILLFA